MGSKRNAAEAAEGAPAGAGVGALPFSIRFWDGSEIGVAGRPRFPDQGSGRSLS